MNYNFNQGDYICGIESITLTEDDKPNKIVRGWVERVIDDTNTILIKVHDASDKSHQTVVNLDTAYHCNYVEKWWEADERSLPVGTVVRHFKDKQYKILGYAYHVDGGRCVVYKALYGPGRVYVREYTEFMSEVDHKKYPDVKQKYCFEAVEV